MDEGINPEILEQGGREGSVENEPAKVESHGEHEVNMIKGAEVLEDPPQGNHLLGLQAFIQWVNSLLAKKD